MTGEFLETTQSGDFDEFAPYSLPSTDEVKIVLNSVLKRVESVSS